MPQSRTDSTPQSPILPAFQRVSRRLRLMAMRLLGNEDDADDTLQDAFCRLWPRRTDIHSEPQAEALLTATVRNLSISRLRQQQATPTLHLDDSHEVGSAILADCKEYSDGVEVRFREVESLIETRLSPTARTILHRREYEGQDFDTIAAELGMQPAAVRVQLSRARKTILTAYKDYHPS